MKTSFRKALTALVGTVLVGATAAATGCGGDGVPSDAVAKVGNTVITKQAFDHWYASAAKAQAQQGGLPVTPDPPAYAKCIAGIKAREPKGSKPKDSDLKQQCKQGYDQLKQQVMQFLLQSQWVLQEVEEQDLNIGGAEVRKLFEEQKTTSFPKEKDYKKFLRTSGATEQDILFRIKLDALQKKLTEKVQKEQEEVSDEDVEAYYEKNKEQFTQPEQRDLNVVLTKGKAKAEQAKQELEGGAKFPAVAKKYSADQASKAQGGKLPAVTRGRQEKAFDDAIFGAEKSELVGPVKTQLGWYVFEVTAITPANTQPLDDAEEAIRGVVAQQNEQKALQDFIEEFREDYKEKTRCREGFVVAECDNAPDETTDTGPASGGAPAAPGAAPTPPADPNAPPAQPSP